MSQTAYIPPPATAHEEERLEELYSLQLLDTAAEQRFDRYTSLVAELFDFPVVLVTLVDRDRQWFKSKVGWDKEETPRAISFCGHAINQGQILVVPDTLKDPRFADNPLVAGPPYIRFYAGAVVRGPRGHPLGTLCLIDHQPRELDPQQCSRLRQFADLIESEIAHSHDLETLRASVEFSAYYDPLTHLPNRRLLMDRLGKLLELSVVPRQRQVAILLFRVADLRLLTQSLGSEGSNELIRQLGLRLTGCCPASGSVARLRDDEFVMAFPVFHPETGDVDIIAGCARGALEKPFVQGGKEHYLRVQIGASLFPEQGTSPEALIEQASMALHANGKSESEPDAVRYFSQTLSESLSERLKIESCLRGATPKNEFHLLYQPIISLAEGKLEGVEALLRWDSPELGQVPPERFIPLAEETGLILDIGRWVQAEVCKQLQQWCRDPSWDTPVAINVSAVELAHPMFARGLVERLQAAGISGELLWIEITEFSLLSDSALVDQNLNALQKHAVRINIDDFGTGYSSLSYLRRLPVNSVKIDRSFIEGLPRNEDGAALTRTIISMAQALGVSPVAEGIEDREQLEFLCNNHCQYGQGYLISPPLSADQIPPLRGRTLT